MIFPARADPWRPGLSVEGDQGNGDVDGRDERRGILTFRTVGITGQTGVAISRHARSAIGLAVGLFLDMSDNGTSVQFVQGRAPERAPILFSMPAAAVHFCSVSANGGPTDRV